MSMLVSLRMLEWQLIDPVRIRDHRREGINSTKVSPALLKDKINQAILDKHVGEFVQKIRRKGFGTLEDFGAVRTQGPDFDTTRKLVNNKNTEAQSGR